MSGAVPPAARARDAIALALLAAGAGTYVVAWRGMQALAEQRVNMPQGEWLMSRWNSYHNLSQAGLVGMAAGAAVAAWSFMRHRTPPTAETP